MINYRRNAEKKEQRADLLSTLLDANDAFADTDLRLTDQEALGMESMVIHLVMLAYLYSQRTSSSSSLPVRLCVSFSVAG